MTTKAEFIEEYEKVTGQKIDEARKDVKAFAKTLNDNPELRHTFRATVEGSKIENATSEGLNLLFDTQ